VDLPFTDLEAAIIQLHELFLTCKRQGFTNEQSFQITLTVLAGTFNQPRE